MWMNALGCAYFALGASLVFALFGWVGWWCLSLSAMQAERHEMDARGRRELWAVRHPRVPYPERAPRKPTPPPPDPPKR